MPLCEAPHAPEPTRQQRNQLTFDSLASIHTNVKRAKSLAIVFMVCIHARLGPSSIVPSARYGLAFGTRQECQQWLSSTNSESTLNSDKIQHGRSRSEGGNEDNPTGFEPSMQSTIFAHSPAITSDGKLRSVASYLRGPFFAATVPPA